MKTVRLLVVVCVALFLMSCNLKPMWDISGKWEKVEGVGTIEFLKSGQVMVNDGVISLTTTYTFLDPEHLEFHLGDLGNAVLEVSVSKDELVLTKPNGEIAKFQRKS